MTRTPCPAADRLAAFHAGRLPAADIDRVAAHLEGCPACEGRLRELDGFPEPVADALRHPAPDPDPATLAAPGAAPGLVVGGRYKLVERIGEGGMGEVWVAQQTDPVRRAVAVKLIKPGMDSRSVLARFEAERQALALMDHPNIAKVLDAGTTDRGRPYFVMELVKGVPVTRFCDDRKLTPRERLGLFVPVCQAVQHAHQKGVIHRDLKPTNILVALYDDRPVPKVIDFGVAKAAGQPLTDKTLLTAFGAVIGTPEYMSPEQATFNQLDVDTRTDVYALGVLLYELLTGATPLTGRAVAAAGLLEALRVVREQDPPRPSTRLSTAAALPAIAAARGTEPAALARLVRGELDWIVMKCLEKDRARRYETATGLAMDVERYLAGEPVRAVPPSPGYLARKLVRRHRRPVLAAGLVLLALVGGVAGTTAGLIRAEAARRDALAEAARAGLAERRAGEELGEANRARARAEREREASAALAGFLHYDVIQQADVRRQAEWRDVVDPDLTLREALDRAAARIDAQAGVTRRAEALIRWAIGDAYVAVGRPDRAVPHLERAWRLHADDPEYGPGHGETTFGLHKLAAAHRAAGRPAAALPLSERALALARDRHARDPVDTQGPWVAMLDVALARLDLGQAGPAAGQLEEAERWAAEKFPPGLADTRLLLAGAYRAAGRPADARRLLAGLLAGEEAGADDLMRARVQEALARALADAGEWGSAEGPLRACLDTRRRREPRSWTTPATAALLGEVLLRQGKAGEAGPLLADARRELQVRDGGVPPRSRAALAEAAGRLADLAAARDEPAAAAAWRAEQARHRAARPAPEGGPGSGP